MYHRGFCRTCSPIPETVFPLPFPLLFSTSLVPRHRALNRPRKCSAENRPWYYNHAIWRPNGDSFQFRTRSDQFAFLFRFLSGNDFLFVSFFSSLSRSVRLLVCIFSCTSLVLVFVHGSGWSRAQYKSPSAKRAPYIFSSFWSHPPRKEV